MIQFLLSLLFVYPTITFACSTAAITQSQEKFVGNNYDWHQDHGLAYVNKRGMKKVSLPFKATDNPHRWTSKYASLTFTQHGRGLPLEGVNEEGLVIEVMVLGSSTYPAVDDRPTLNETEWIQYHLDTYASVEEVLNDTWDPVSGRAKIRHSNVGVKVHYLMCDKKVECATFEWIEGKLEVHRPEQMNANSLTNSTYSSSLGHLSKFDGFGGSSPLPLGNDSLSRFVRVTHAAENYREDVLESSVEAAFRVMDVAKVPSTVWQIVFEAENSVIHYKTKRNPSLKTIRLQEFDLSCGAPEWFPIQSNESGLLESQFKTYSPSKNLEVLFKGMEVVGDIPAEKVRQLAAYIEHNYQCEN